MKQYQTFNAGVAKFCELVNTAENGAQPEMAPGEPFLTLRYDLRTFGLRSMEAMAGLGQRADRLIRVPASGEMRKVNTQTVCVTEDGTKYHIKRLQDVTVVTPQSVDIYLERMGLP